MVSFAPGAVLGGYSMTSFATDQIVEALDERPRADAKTLKPTVRSISRDARLPSGL